MKILMVCLGNICRSPLAHGIMENMIQERQLPWLIDSAGTGSWHVGESPDPRAIAVARLHGIDISRQRAQHFQKDHFEQYDYILVMDNQNLKDVSALAHTSEKSNKVKLFLGDKDLSDPYYDDALFEPVYRQIEQRCKYWLDYWENLH